MAIRFRVRTLDASLTNSATLGSAISNYRFDPRFLLEQSGVLEAKVLDERRELCFSVLSGIVNIQALCS